MPIRSRRLTRALAGVAGLALALPLTLAAAAPAWADVCPIGRGDRPPYPPTDDAGSDDAGDDAGEEVGALGRRGRPVREAGGVIVFAASMGGLWLGLRRRQGPR